MKTNEESDDFDQVTSEWFLPHFPPRKERPLEYMMRTKWEEYASYQDDFNNQWQTRIESMMRGIPRISNVRGGRLASTFMLWSVTNNGRAFLYGFYRELERAPDFHKNETAVRYLAQENMLGITKNFLEHLLQNEHGIYVYCENPYPTLEDYRVVEMMCIFLSSESGQKFLYDVYLADKNLKYLPCKSKYS